MTTPARAQRHEQPQVDSAQAATRLRMIVGRLNRRMRLNPAGDGLTSTQLATLATIERHGPLRIGDLAAAEGISATTMTRVVAGLSDLDLIERHPDPDDGRACQVLLSPHGEAQLARLRAQLTGYLATRLDTFTPEQRATLDAALPVLELLAHDATTEA